MDLHGVSNSLIYGGAKLGRDLKVKKQDFEFNPKFDREPVQ